MSVIQVQALNKTFDKNKALNNVCLSIESGQMVALIGASGSGKSTLIRHIAGLVKGDRDSGEIQVLNQIIQKNGRLGRGVRKVRSDVGVVFQQFNLINRISVLTNVLLGYLGQISSWRGTLGIFSHAEKRRAMDALARVGIDALASQRSSTLSGGQQQRAAIARTITQGAKVILADEPIASLDPACCRTVMDTLQRINREDEVTILVSLHQVEYAMQYCPRTIAMRQGEVVFDGPSEKLTPQFLKQLYGDQSLELIGNKNQEEPVENIYPDNVAAFATA